MARLPRLVVPGLPHHLVLRGNNRQHVFADERDYQEYLDALREAALLNKVRVHAYVLMPNQVHLLLTPADEQGMSRMMQSVGRRYGAAFNRRHQRTGTLWEGRFRAAVIDPARHFLEVCVYIDTNPVRAGLVERDEDWPWSSLAHHLGRKVDALVADYPAYWGLGNTPFEREAAYRALCERGLGSSAVERITAAAIKGWALGSPAFLAQLAGSTSRPLQPRPRGRPARSVPRDGAAALIKKTVPN